MIGADDLDAAVTEGIIDRAQAIRLRHLAESRRAAGVRPADAAAGGPVDPDDERFRLIGGFNDIFVSIGVGLLAAALMGLARILGLGEAFAATGLVVAWGLAEWFSRRMRLALPSIVLALMFAAAAAALAALLARALIVAAAPPEMEQGLVLVVAGLAVVLAGRLHHWRFRVPIDSAVSAVGGIAMLAGLLLIAAPRLLEVYPAPIAFAVGLAVFALAMRADIGDPLRRTRRSDSAFWLHLLAAPLIVHPVISLVTGGIGQLSTFEAVLVLVLFALLGLVAIVIDRRALLVSGLSYAGIAIAYLLSQRLEGGLGMPLALLGLAIVVLGLSAGWRGLRRQVVLRLPLGSLARHLPPVVAPLP